MKTTRRQTLLFVACAVVLLATGYAWGYANTYNQFYSPDASIDRELMPLDFNARVLHHLNAGQPVQCQRALKRQLRQQITFVQGLLGASSEDTRSDGDRKLRQAAQSLEEQSLANDASAPANASGR